MELARRVGLPMIGVNLPAHFMIRPDVEGMGMLVDCFRGGKVMFAQDVQDMLQQRFFGPANREGVTIDQQFLKERQVRPRNFFTRMLTNLRLIYFNLGEYESAHRIIQYQTHCAPDNPTLQSIRRDSGVALFLMKRYRESIEEFSGYLQDNPDGIDAEAVARMVEKARE